MSTPLSSMSSLASGALLGVFEGGVAARHTPALTVVLGMEPGGLVALPLALVLLPIHWNAWDMLLAFAAGAVGGLGLIAFYRAMTMSLIGTVAPVTGVVAGALPVGVGMLRGDHLRIMQVAGIMIGLGAIALINGVGQSSVEKGAPGMSLAILAGIAFGLFFVLFHAGSTAGTPAFLSARVGSEAALLPDPEVRGSLPRLRPPGSGQRQRSWSQFVPSFRRRRDLEASGAGVLSERRLVRQL